MTLRPELNFNVQLARIYGEQDNVSKMYESYLDFVQLNEGYKNTIKRAFSEFISEDSNNENNIILRRLLLKKIQSDQSLLWNEMLSWLFVQQKDYNKAFTQEKAIFFRQPESLDRIEELALIASADKEYDVALDIFNYLTETAQDLDTKLKAYYNLIEIKKQLANKDEYKNILDQYKTIFDTYGTHTKTLFIQISYAHFLAFYKHEPSQAVSVLKQSLRSEE